MIEVREYNLTVPYSKGVYNKVGDTEQWIRISEGCPNQCVYCAETWENGRDPIYYEIPEIVRNKVIITDMNLIYKPRALEIIEELGRLRVNGKVVKYVLKCGVDYRYLTQEISSALKQNRFVEMKIAWDYGYDQAYKIKDAINKLMYAGYSPRNIQVFIICNWRIPYEECCMKLDTLKVWGVQVSDCWFDNQIRGKVKPIHWTEEQIKDFSKKTRDHGIMIRMNGIQTEKIKS